MMNKAKARRSKVKATKNTTQFIRSSRNVIRRIERWLASPAAERDARGTELARARLDRVRTTGKTKAGRS